MRGSFALFRYSRENFVKKVRSIPKTLRPLPSDNMILVNAGKELKDKSGNISKHVLAFNVTPTMTKIDIKNYLEKIYGVKVLHVSTLNRLGQEKRVGMSFYKRKDIKRAYVHLDPSEPEFEFPELFSKEDLEAKEKKAEEEKKQDKKGKSWSSYVPSLFK